MRSKILSLCAAVCVFCTLLLPARAASINFVTSGGIVYETLVFGAPVTAEAVTVTPGAGETYTGELLTTEFRFNVSEHGYVTLSMSDSQNLVKCLTVTLHDKNRQVVQPLSTVRVTLPWSSTLALDAGEYYLTAASTPDTQSASVFISTQYVAAAAFASLNGNYEVTVTASSVSGGQAYGNKAYVRADETFELTAEAAAGYTFSEWRVLSAKDAVYTMPVGPAVTEHIGDAVIDTPESETTTARIENNDGNRAADIEIQAVFAKAAQVTLQQSTGGTIRLKNPSVGYNKPVGIAAAGYIFSEWQVLSGSACFDDTTKADTNLTVSSGSVTVAAVFKKHTKYLITVSGASGGEISTNTYSAYAGDTVRIYADADSEYEFTRWNISGIEITNPQSDNTTFVMPEQDVSLSALFTALDPKDIYYDIDVYAELEYSDGTISSGSYGGAVTASRSTAKSGASARITASARSGYVFERWEITAGDCDIADETKNSTTITVGSSDVQLTAVFKKRLELSVLSADTSKGSVSALAYYGGANTETAITASPKEGFIFDRWEVTSASGTVTDTRAAAAVFVFGTGNAAVKAYFIADPSVSGTTPAEWAVMAIDEAVSQNLVPSQIRSQYSSAITRKDFCLLAVNLYMQTRGYVNNINGLAQSVGADVSPFTDTDDIYVITAYSLGVVNGMGGGVYEPDRSITRQEAAKILHNLGNVLGAGAPGGADVFSDVGSVSDWARDSVGYVKTSGIMDGVGGGAFAPLGLYTREQSVKTILALYKLTR